MEKEAKFLWTRSMYKTFVQCFSEVVDSTSAYPDVETQNWLQAALHLKYVSGFDKRDHFTHYCNMNVS